MIHINWYHQNLPRALGAFSFFINPVLIFLVVSKSKSQIGEYKKLLIIFAIFDILYSISEIVTPIGVQGNSHGFIVFITEGPFFENPEIGQHAMSNRCGFISLSYALLIIHFVYRYVALFQ
uniref:Uncharacterized protein n=1 Tax=Caenorhabditis japonica TaxID=281687 RepID=A0A8R1HNI2_CAEJA